MIGENPVVQSNGRYRPKETAEMFGVSRRTLERWVHRGYIRRDYTALEGKPVFLGKEILRWWEKKYQLVRY